MRLPLLINLLPAPAGFEFLEEPAVPGFEENYLLRFCGPLKAAQVAGS
jgi:hypothetical protein